MSVSAQFVTREAGSHPKHLVCEAELYFGPDAGPLAGMKLVGFTLWRAPDGDAYVTFPSRAFGAGVERRFFDYLRSSEGDAADGKRLKAWIIGQFKASNESGTA